jgi:hypothetical protein
VASTSGSQASPPQPQASTTATSSTAKKSYQKNHSSPVPYPVEMPPLSSHLQAASDSGKLANHHNELELVRDLGRHLHKLTSGLPTTRDYENFSLSAVEKYTFLGDEEQKNVSSYLKFLPNFAQECTKYKAASSLL